MLNILKDIVDIVYPPKQSCLFCKSPIEKYASIQLCRSCLRLLQFLSDNTCTRCGRPIEGVQAENLCNECSTREMYFDGGCSVFEFSEVIQKALHELKYENKMDIAVPIGRLMAARLKKENWKIDMILPVPLHSKRLEERGFNQSEILAVEVGWERGIGVHKDILIRKRYTESQVSLTRLERILNLRNAFGVNKTNRIKGKSILIIDDIMTTASTLNECSRALKENGAKRVYCLTAATPIHI